MQQKTCRTDQVSTLDTLEECLPMQQETRRTCQAWTIKIQDMDPSTDDSDDTEYVPTQNLPDDQVSTPDTLLWQQAH